MLTSASAGSADLRSETCNLQSVAVSSAPRMTSIHLIQSILVLPFLLLALGSGYLWSRLGAGLDLHLALGGLAILGACLVHCIVFTYLIGTGKSVRQAVMAHDLDPGLIEETRVFKKKAFPFLHGSLLLLVILMVLGLNVGRGRVSPWIHGTLGLVAVILNMVALVREHQVIVANGRLIASLKEKLSGLQDVWGTPTGLAEDEAPDGALPETLARALGFFGWTAWLPYVYVRFIMNVPGTPWWPFVLGAVLCLAGQWWLQRRKV